MGSRLALLLGSAGCDPGAPPGDATPPDAPVSDAPKVPDAAAPDAATPDAATLDAAVDRPRAEVGPPPDARPRGPLTPVERCGDAPVFAAEDLSLGAGRVTFVTIPEEAFGPRRLSAGDGCVQYGAAQAVVRYVPRSSSRLFIRRVGSEGGLAHLGSHWLSRGCGAAGPAEVLSCGSDLLDTATSQRTSTARPVAAGEPLLLVYDAGAADRVTLAITEVPDTLPTGAACDAEGLVAACAEGSSCGWSDAGDRRCVRDGSARDAACRGPAPRCDAGLACHSETGLSLDAVCQDAREAAPDRACSIEHPCVVGTCLATASGQRCVARGRAMAPCRDAAPACDDGLVCTREPAFRGGHCVPGGIPPGGRCELDLGTGACAPGAWCVPVDATTGSCRPLGSEGAPCRPTASPCDDGLACADHECRRAGVGVPCRPLPPRCDGSARCVAGRCDPRAEALPIPAGDLDPRCPNEGRYVALAGGCVPLGEEGGYCRLGDAPCEPGLRCIQPPTGAHAPLCARVHARGEPCLSWRERVPAAMQCEAGYSCPRGRADPVCAPVGTVGTTCDRARPGRLCEAGTACVGDVCTPAALTRGRRES